MTDTSSQSHTERWATGGERRTPFPRDPLERECLRDRESPIVSVNHPIGEELQLKRRHSSASTTCFFSSFNFKAPRKKKTTLKTQAAHESSKLYFLTVKNTTVDYSNARWRWSQIFFQSVDFLFIFLLYITKLTRVNGYWFLYRHHKNSWLDKRGNYIHTIGSNHFSLLLLMLLPRNISFDKINGQGERSTAAFSV